MPKLLLSTFILSLGTLIANAQEVPKPDAPKADQAPVKKVTKTQEQLEKEFEDRMTNSSLVGFFTTDNQKTDKPLAPDRYKLGKVQKMPGKEDQYLFTYDHKGVPIPLLLTVKWAGTTPVLVLDDLTIPTLGTFSSRVMFDGERYAGTWQHGATGGLMFGKIEKTEVKKKE